MRKQRASLSDRPLPRVTAPRVTDDLIMGLPQERREVVDLLVHEIMPNRQQPRTQPNQAALRELADSIQQHGVLEPILVRSISLTEFEGAGCRYELIAGERRWRASKLAGRTTIPAMLLPANTNDREMLELAIIENLQREDLHPLDEAMALGRMHSDLGYSYAQIGERLGKSKGYVQNRMRLLQLSEDLQQLVAERPDTLKHVSEIARITDAGDRAALIQAVRTDALSFAMTQARVQALLEPPTQPTVSYSREYDSDKKHNEGSTTPQIVRSYLREYDSDKKHNPGSDGSAAVALLNVQERAVVAAVARKVQLWVTAPDQVSVADWEALEPLAQSLVALLQAMGARGAK